eukprot:2839598-Rhodomonas_salina.1
MITCTPEPESRLEDLRVHRRLPSSSCHSVCQAGARVRRIVDTGPSELKASRVHRDASPPDGVSSGRDTGVPPISLFVQSPHEITNGDCASRS